MSSTLQDIVAEMASNEEKPPVQTETTPEVKAEEPAKDDKPSSLNTDNQEPEGGEPEPTEPEKEVAVKPEGTTDPDPKEEAPAEPEEEGFTPEEFIQYILSETEGNEEIRDSILKGFGVNKTPYADERIEQINKFVQETGRTVEDYLFIQSLDTEKMDNKSAVIQSLALDNPELDASELQILFETTYKLDEEEYSEKEIKASEVLLKRDGKKAISRFNELKSEWQKPVPKQKEQEPAKYLPDGFEKLFKSEVNEVGSFEFDINDKGEKFEYKIDDKYGESVEDFNTQDPLYRYRDSKGNIDAYQMAEDRALIDNIDSIIKSAYQAGLSSAKEQMVVEKKNLDINQQNRPPEQKPETDKDKQTKHIMENWL